MSAPNAKQWVDAENGLVDRIIFSDPEIYRWEMERIFARAWNFICHESQIPEPGDFFLNSIGEDRVIAVRNKAGEIGVLLNTCRHRGNAVCRAEQGNTRVFTCPYHGWSYDLDGALVGVPGFKEFYRGGLDKAQWGLARAAQVASHRGFVFATLDREAIPLDDYLGEVGRIGLDLIANRGDVEVVDGIQKNVIGCNWKLAVDNLYDWYHPPVSHRSASRSGFSPVLADENAAYQPMNQMVLLGEYGHGIGGPRLSEEQLAAAREAGGSVTGDRVVAPRAGGAQRLRRSRHPHARPPEHLPQRLDHARRHAALPAPAARPAADRVLVVHVRREGTLAGSETAANRRRDPPLRARRLSRAGRRRELGSEHEGDARSRRRAATRSTSRWARDATRSARTVDRSGSRPS